MRTTPTRQQSFTIQPRLTMTRALVISTVLVMMAGLFFAYAPFGQVAAARQAFVASTTAKKIFSFAPAAVRRAIQSTTTQLKARANAIGSPANLMMAPVTITKDASPPSGSAVGQGQVIAYTIQATNGASSDTTTGAGGVIVISDTAPAGTLFTAVTVQQQPQFGSAWNCGIVGGGTSFNCVAGDGGGAGIDTFTTQEFVRIRAEATVGAATAIGTMLTNTAVYAFGASAPPVAATATSNATVHEVRPTADLSLSKFVNAGGGNNGGSVIAGGTSAAYTTSGVASPGPGTGNIDYQLLVGNGGPGNGSSVIIQDSIPNNTVVVSAPALNPASIFINGVAQPTFAINCAIFSGNFIECRPGDNTALNPAWGVDVLPAGFSARLNYRVRVPANVAQGTIIQNEARISSVATNPGPGTLTADPNAGNNTSTPVNTNVIAQTDLGITKQTSNATPVAGGAAFSYTLVVTNNGPSDANNIVVTDPLPPGIVLANNNIAVVNNPSVAGYGLLCTGPANGSNGTITCTGNLPGGPGGTSTSTITIVAQVVPNVASGVRTNTATVTSSTQEVSPNVSPNTASVQQNITVNAPLSIVKDGPAAVCAGDTYTYHITVNNGGSSTALNATISDPLPADTTFLNLSGTGAFANTCSHNGGTPGTVTCPAVDIPTGQSTLDITVKLAGSAPGNTLGNTATITNAGTGTIAVGTSTSTATINHCGDMAITKTAPDALGAGTVIDYVLKLANHGPSDLFGGAAPGTITVMDTLPTQVAALISTTAGPGEAGGFTCTSAGSPIKVTCVNAANGAGNFPVGATANLTIKVRIDSAAVVNTNIQNCGMVAVIPQAGLTQLDANDGNNTACASSVVSALLTQADLSAAKSAVPVVDPDGAGPLVPVALPIAGPNVPAGSVNAGGYIRYDIPFGNNGPADATNVIITDQIAGNTAFVGALATGGVFVPASQPPAIPFTFTIQAVDTVAPLGPNVNLTCTVWQGAGSQSIYCRPQGNTGLPAPGPYADGTIPAGYTGTLTFFVKVNESVAGGTIVANPANITSGLCPNAQAPAFPPVACLGTLDTNAANNTTLATQTLVINSSNLTISKVVQSAVTSASNPNQTGPLGPATAPNGTATTGTAVLPGTTLTYRVTLTNNGPSDVSNIRLTDLLPSGLESPPGRVLGVRYISATPVLPSGATFTCAPPSGVDPSNNPQSNGGSVVCTAPLLSANVPNNTAAVDIKVFIDATTKASLVNTATVDATLNNFNRPISGSTTLTTPVAATSDLALTKTHINAAGVLGGPVTAGTDFEYQVTITNNGPSAAQMVNLVDTIPGFQSLLLRNQLGTLVPDITIETTPDGNGAPAFSCTAAADATTDPRATTSSITCTAAELPANKKADGTVNPAGTVRFRIRMRQSGLTPQPAPLTANCVTATSMSADPVAGNNTNICDTVPVIFNSTLGAAKVDTPDPVVAGNLLTYTITASPEGSSAALNFTIEDPLPLGTVLVSAVASPGATLITPAVNSNGTVKAVWDAAGGTDGTPGTPGNDGLTGAGVVRTLTIVVRVCPDFQQTLNLTDAQMCVPNLTNVARIYSDTPPTLGITPRLASQTTTVQAQSDLSLTKTAPATINFSTTLNASVITYTLNFSNAGPSNASNVTITDVLPKAFTVQGTPTSTLAGTTFTVTTTAGVTTVVANLGVLGAANQCSLTPRPTSGTVTIRAIVPVKHPVVSVTNTATIATTNCLADPNLANNTASATTAITDPGALGQSFPARSEISDDKAGSILFYPFYISDAANPSAQNSRISITNVSGTEITCVHLFAIDGATCAVLDTFVCLTPNQTAAFLMSDFDPGASGYVVAVAVDCVTGLPTNFNCLIGDESFKTSNGYAANVGAEAISALMPFPAGVDTSSTTATLRFDGMSYSRLPRQLAVSNIPGPNDNNSTMFVLNRVGGNYTVAGDSIGAIAGQLFDDAEQALSFTANMPSCQYRTVLSNTFPRTFNPFNRFIASGRTGWMKFAAAEDRALLGLTVNANSNTRSNVGAFSQGHNMHKLTLTDSARIIVPVYLPTCQ